MGNLLARLIGAIFGLVFAGFGFYFLSQTVVPVAQAWFEMRSWRPGSATLEMVGGAENETLARYSYIVDGTTYSNDRVYPITVKDNIGSYHVDLQQRLKKLQRTNSPAAIWINPTHPSEAVIDRDIRWGFLLLVTGFCSVFIGIGALAFFSSLKAKGKGRKETPTQTDAQLDMDRVQNVQDSFSTIDAVGDYSRELEESSSLAKELSGLGATERWQRNKKWKSSKICSEAGSGVIGMWLFGLVWCGVSSPILFYFQDEWNSGNYAVLIGLLFPLVGIFLLYKAIVKSLEWSRFGIIEYSMDPYPGAIGGNVGGSLQIGKLQNARAEYRIDLECIYSYMTGSGKRRSRHEKTIWAETGLAKASRSIEGTRLQFRFDVPDNLPESDYEQTGDYHLWRLKVRCDLLGSDLNRSYNIPVFRTGESSSFVRHDLSSQFRKQRKKQGEKARMAMDRGDFEEAGLSQSVRVTKKDSGVLFVYPMFRNKILFLFALFFGICFGGSTVGILIGFSGVSFFGIVSMVFAIPFGLVGLFSFGSAIYLLLNNLRVTIGRGELIVMRRLFIIPVFFKRIKNRDISELSLKSTGSSGRGVAKIEQFKIAAQMKDGSKLTIAESIRGEELARQFKDYLFKRIRSGY